MGDDGGEEAVAWLLWPLASGIELADRPEAVAAARRHVRGTLLAWGIPADVAGDALMVCSELVTNALRATWGMGGAEDRWPVVMRLLANGERLVIEAWDSHPGTPVLGPVEDQAEGGRGLAIVDALANRWGWRRLSAHVKAVWAELLLPAPGTADPTEGTVR
jgi:anti-sigma regulatory factor (Ser/Thr protein kinase)